MQALYHSNNVVENYNGLSFGQSFLSYHVMLKIYEVGSVRTKVMGAKAIQY